MATGEKCFKFIWKIENISYCLQKLGECIRSPTFTVYSIHEMKCYLDLYPRGCQDGNHIELFLYRDLSSKGPDLVNIKYELSLLAECHSVLESFGSHTADFRKNHGFGFAQLPKREDVFNTKRSKFLPQDNLTLCCKIWETDRKMSKDVQCFARTCIGIQRRCFLWNVKDFSRIKGNDKYTCIMKSTQGDASFMSLDFSLSEGLFSDEKIHFKLTLLDKIVKFYTSRLSLVTAFGCRVDCNQDEFWFDSSLVECKQFTFFFTKNELMAMQSLYLPDDVLSLHWELTFSEGVILQKIENIQFGCTSFEGNSDLGILNKKNKISLPNTMNKKLKSSLDQKFLCDVKLQTNTRTFDAHKIILSASSPVFEAMFSNDMKEKNSNLVNIEDLSEETVSRMLLYIYTGSVEDLTSEISSQLYIAADKYGILSLKEICSSYIKDNLSSSNACDVLLLSDFHADGDLKSVVQNYILHNGKQITNSKEWNALMQCNAKLAAETLCRMFK